MALHDILRLLRPQQWYKNLLVFLPLIFVDQLFSPDLFPSVLLAFLALCLVSSAGYTFNDIIDRQSDRKNPEKKHRPIASGAVHIFSAALLLITLLAIGDALLWWLDWRAGAAALGMFAITCCYSLFLKNEPVIDVLALGVNFVLRAAVGAFVIDVVISPWLILCTFFLSL
ncbi:MAG: UbiA prenyltransferase family protein, partial [Nanoarchaeota archaeon]